MKNSSIQANLFKPTCWLETEDYLDEWIELVSKELNHLAAMFMPGVWILWSKKKKNLSLFFKKKMEILLHF